MGVKERYDARDWAVWAKSHFGPEVPIFLMGVSMGAATVLLAAGLDLPANVCGIVADCGYTSPPRHHPQVPAGVSARLPGRAHLRHRAAGRDPVWPL